MDNQSVHDNMQGVKQLTLAQITKAFRLKKSTVNYVAKRSDRLRDMPPEAAPGRSRKFELEQGVRFVAAVMLVRGGVPLDIAGPLLDRIEGIANEANKVDEHASPEYRYSSGTRLAEDPWLLTIRNDDIGRLWRDHVGWLSEHGHGHLENMTHAFVVSTLGIAGDDEFNTWAMQLVLDLTEIETRLARLTNAKS